MARRDRERQEVLLETIPGPILLVAEVQATELLARPPDFPQARPAPTRIGGAEVEELQGTFEGALGSFPVAAPPGA